MEGEHRITPLELFFDLVFVFAFTQVTTADLGGPDLGGGWPWAADPAALWWAWASYAWLTNTVDAERGRGAGRRPGSDGARCSSPRSRSPSVRPPRCRLRRRLSDRGGDAPGAVCALGPLRTRLFVAILRIVPRVFLGASLILAAGFVDGRAKAVIWIAALAVGFLGPLFADVEGWRLAPAHFVERHGLIVIIAIGESLSRSVSAPGHRSRLQGRRCRAARPLVATSFWLAYFDYFPIRAQQLLSERQGTDRIALARDAYSYLHLPMVAGIVLFAFAMKMTLAHVGRELDTIPAFALCVGPAVYLLAFVALRLRVSRTLGRGRILAALAFMALFPVARAVPALGCARARRRRVDRASCLRDHLVARPARRGSGPPMRPDGDGMAGELTIVGLGGSLAQISRSRAALRVALAGAADAGARTTLLDLRELDLPMYDPDEDDRPPSSAARLIEACYGADGMLWSSPMYQGTISGAFKNALDWLHPLGARDPSFLHDKVVGLISAAGGTQGLQAINTMEFASERSARGRCPTSSRSPARRASSTPTARYSMPPSRPAANARRRGRSRKSAIRRRRLAAPSRPSASRRRRASPPPDRARC